ncbi:thioredoxin domain-containing protein [Mycobacteroides abscessus]|uniref:NrdH-redoxin n=1 Tax=Mycobacteroides abscessus TaxID=36809 RepID=UPI00373FD6CF
MTKNRLDKRGVQYSSVIADVEQVASFKADGHSSFPVVVVDCGDGATWTWAGFRPHHMERLSDLVRRDSPVAA